MLNKPLLRKVMEHIEAHPTEHDQETWGSQNECGTTFCFAGHAAVISGWEPVWKDRMCTECVHVDTGERGHVENVAIRELGLAAGDWMQLFRWTTSREALRRVVDDFLARPDELEAGDPCTSDPYVHYKAGDRPDPTAGAGAICRSVSPDGLICTRAPHLERWQHIAGDGTRVVGTWFTFPRKSVYVGEKGVRTW